MNLTSSSSSSVCHATAGRQPPHPLPNTIYLQDSPYFHSISPLHLLFLADLTCHGDLLVTAGRSRAHYQTVRQIRSSIAPLQPSCFPEVFWFCHDFTSSDTLIVDTIRISLFQENSNQSQNKACTKHIHTSCWESSEIKYKMFKLNLKRSR